MGPDNILEIKAIDAIVWQTRNRTSFDEWLPAAFAVFLGYFAGYHPTITLYRDCDSIRGFIIEEHAPGEFHAESYYMLALSATKWIKEWKVQRVCIGGPGITDPSFSNEPMVEVDPTEIVLLPPPRNESYAFVDIANKLAKELREGYPFEPGRSWQPGGRWTREAWDAHNERLLAERSLGNN
ncbi:hypothetical protein FRC12_006870 [Ceratobasidium sp. 428]|nr:hypothetical protein FRC12_006870 [Ceratobasidium sp. 428]